MPIEKKECFRLFLITEIYLLLNLREPRYLDYLTFANQNTQRSYKMKQIRRRDVLALQLSMQNVMSESVHQKFTPTEKFAYVIFSYCTAGVWRARLLLMIPQSNRHSVSKLISNKHLFLSQYRKLFLFVDRIPVRI